MCIDQFEMSGAICFESAGKTTLEGLRDYKNSPNAGTLQCAGHDNTPRLSRAHRQMPGKNQGP